MQKSESITNLAKALVGFQNEVTNPSNSANNPFFNSRYAPLPEILNLVRPLLSKHGLTIVQSPSGDGTLTTINTMILHSSGEWIELDPLTMKAEKSTPQGQGSCITYGRRYSLASALNLASEDDDDGNLASHKEPLPKAFTDIKKTITDAKKGTSTPSKGTDICEDCGGELDKRVADYSVKFFGGKKYCTNCQKKHKK